MNDNSPLVKWDEETQTWEPYNPALEYLKWEQETLIPSLEQSGITTQMKPTAQTVGENQTL